RDLVAQGGLGYTTSARARRRPRHGPTLGRRLGARRAKPSRPRRRLSLHLLLSLANLLRARNVAVHCPARVCRGVGLGAGDLAREPASIASLSGRLRGRRRRGRCVRVGDGAAAHAGARDGVRVWPNDPGVDEALGREGSGFVAAWVVRALGWGAGRAVSSEARRRDARALPRRRGADVGGGEVLAGHRGKGEAGGCAKGEGSEKQAHCSRGSCSCCECEYECKCEWLSGWLSGGEESPGRLGHRNDATSPSPDQWIWERSRVCAAAAGRSNGLVLRVYLAHVHPSVLTQREERGTSLIGRRPHFNSKERGASSCPCPPSSSAAPCASNVAAADQLAQLAAKLPPEHRPPHGPTTAAARALCPPTPTARARPRPAPHRDTDLRGRRDCNRRRRAASARARARRRARGDGPRGAGTSRGARALARAYGRPSCRLGPAPARARAARQGARPVAAPPERAAAARAQVWRPREL
ncbi:hypothetical protein DMC30DRAFT_443594, partial [Rhodotorula diobovata]